MFEEFNIFNITNNNAMLNTYGNIKWGRHDLTGL